MYQRFSTLLVCFLFLFVGSGSASIEETKSQFPVFPALKPNIQFWKSIYSQYNSNQGIIHDTDDLSIIYGTIELEPRVSRSARRRNIQLIRKTKKRYAGLLRKLSRDPDVKNEAAQKIRAMFGDKATAKTYRAAALKIRFQRGQRNFFRDGLVRSGQYLDDIKVIFNRHNLPLDLIYLPHVESSFNFHAYSKFGAAGIWQFTHSTGKRYMTVNYTVDQRWDPIYASEAAARLLKRNYQLLNSWPLALTAYNHGAAAMKRAKKSKGNYERIFSEYDGRRFKFASRNFYAEFLAAREIAKNHQHYFPGLIQNKPIHTKTYTLNGYIPIKPLAEHLKLSTKKLRTMNPSLREPVFRDQKYVPKGFKLRLPADKSLQQRMASIPDDLFKDKQKRSRFYYVRKGDVASVIARRHGITLQELIWANNLDHRARIYSGQNLRIPTAEDAIILAAKFKVPSAAQEQVSAKEKQRKVPVKANLDSEIAANGDGGEINPEIVTANIRVKRAFIRKGVDFGVIQVDTGETLGHFADWLEVSAQSIRNLNGLSFREEIHMDQHLTVPFNRVSAGVFEERRYEFHKEFEEDFLGAYLIEGTWKYKIRRGDNIWTLATEQFELPVWLIRKYNLSVNLNRLRPGQQITIPIVEEKIES